MQPGDLVEIIRAGYGAIALVVDCCYSERDSRKPNLNTDIFEVQFMDGKRRRYLTRDMKVVK